MNIQNESADILSPRSTRAQEGLYVLHCINPENPAYNVSCNFRFSGQINTTALEASLRAIVNRHETLRTSFRLESGRLIRLIRTISTTETQDQFQLLNQQTMPAQLSAEHQQDVLNTQINQPFDLHEAPLFRCTLFSTDAGNEHLFVFVAHHNIFDHISKSIFYQELSAFYNHFAHNKALTLVPLVDQYSHYVHFCEDRSHGPAIARQHKYWAKKLNDSKPINLLLDRDRESMPTSKGVRLEKTLPSDLVVAMRAIAHEQQASFFMAMLSVCKILLSLWTGETDIPVGTHYADRRSPGADKMIGFLLNTLVLRTTLDHEQDFHEVLKAVQKTCFNAYRYSDIAFEELVEEHHEERNYQRNPFFDVRFSHLVDQENDLDFEGIAIESIQLENCRARYDLTFTIRENAGQCFIQVEYRSSLFDSAKIDWLLNQYISLLKALVKKPTKKLKNLTLIDDALRRKLTLEYNNTTQKFPAEKTISELIDDRCGSVPTATALRCEGAQLTYCQLDARSNQLACFLQQSGVKTGDVVAICLHRSLDLVIAALAILKIGAAYLPIDHEYPDSRITHMMSDSETRYLICHSEILKRFPDTGAKVLAIDELQAEIENLSEMALPRPEGHSCDSTAYLIYTSGSTGKPKGVSVSHKNIVNFLCSMQKQPGLTEYDRLLAVTTLSFDIAVLEIWLPLFCGATCVLASRNDAIDGERLSQLLISEKITVMQATPVTWRMLINSGWRGNASLKVLCGGEAMPPDLANELRVRTRELWNMYGPTETTVWSSCYQVTKAESRIPIGKPIDNTALYILDKHKQLVCPGRVGELYIGGTGVTLGYLGREALTREKYTQNPFHSEGLMYATGDAARYRSDGNIECIGRLDGQVKVRGHRIELGEIEFQMNAHPAIKQALATVLLDRNGDQRLVACFETDEPAIDIIDQLRDTLKQSLPAYMVPQNLIYLDALPLTPNGKLDRQSEKISVSEGVNTTSTLLTAQTRLEKAVAEIWTEVLQLETVPVNQTFFDLGGHSLLAMQVLSRIRSELRIKIDPVAMASGTIRELLKDYDDETVEPVSLPGNQSVSPMKTFFFANDELYARLHEPSQSQSPRGAVLLCNSIFTEANNIAWGYHRLASLLAAEGYYVLRFDYFGCGNSWGEDEDGSPERWQNDIGTAAQKLIEVSGFSKLSVVGFRYGATLAAFLSNVAVDKFILWEPVISSREYINLFENRYLHFIENSKGLQKNSVDQSDCEILGFHYTESVRRDLEKLELLNGPLLTSCATVHLVINQQTPHFKALAENLNRVARRLVSEQVDDNISSIQDYDDLLAWLPGKSVFHIVRSITDEVDA